jgi:RNA polymerase sigma-70 factor (ECF subfamily)
MYGVEPATRAPDRELSSRPGRHNQQQALRDGQLMAAVARGDQHAFGELVETELPRVVAVARRVLGNDSEADDVAQEAMLRLWRQAANWRTGEARVRTWLYRVAVNLAIDRLRRRREETGTEAPEIAEPASQQRQLEDRDLAAVVNDALQKLPERQRIALTLFHYEGATMADVAEVMDTSPDAVESLLGRGRRALKKQLAHHWQNILPDAQN